MAKKKSKNKTPFPSSSRVKPDVKKRIEEFMIKENRPSYSNAQDEINRRFFKMQPWREKMGSGKKDKE
jgi:hypothetical protein